MKKISIIAIDDHQMIRQMWMRLFSGHHTMELIGESGKLEEAILLITIKQPDIVLLDINLPNTSGLDALPLIRQASPATKIIGVSMHNQPALAKKMINSGAKGYVTKNSPHEEILNAIEQVMKGNTYLCSEIKQILSEKNLRGESEQKSMKDLSMREIEVVNLIKNGLSSKEIGEKLNISTKTIEVHRYNILKKLNLKNTASLINFVKEEDPGF